MKRMETAIVILQEQKAEIVNMTHKQIISLLFKEKYINVHASKSNELF